MVPTPKVPRENLGGDSYGRRFPEGFGLIIFKNYPNIKGVKRKSGRRLCHVRRIPEGFGLPRHQRFQEKIREAVRMGGGFLKVLADSGLRMVPTSKVPRENLGGGCAMLGGFLKIFGLRMLPTLKVPRENPGGGFLKVLA